MNTIQLPKLTKVSDIPSKKKILLLSDDIRFPSGIATMSREIIIHTAHVFDWVQLGAGSPHPDHGKIFDVSDEINKLRNIGHSYVKIYAHSGYGNDKVLDEVIQYESPDAIMHFTDPRFWDWLYRLEHTIHAKYKLPLIYYNIWDAPPAPFWNKVAYQSCDLLMNISKQTNMLVKLVLGENEYYDIHQLDGNAESKRLLSYVPHGINPTIYKPLSESDAEWGDYQKFLQKFKEKHPSSFVVLWNNRNIRRKMPGDVILAFKEFVNKVPKNKRKDCLLIMKSDVLDENGTDLSAVYNALAPECNIVFIEERVPMPVLNFFYNMANVTINIASNEGFGLTTAESVMAGTPIIVNVTGGLQDQCGFETDDGTPIKFDATFTSNHDGKYKKCGNWAFPVFPKTTSLQGSIPTPYIFDDRCNYHDVADKLFEVYNIPPDELRLRGMAGREWMMSDTAKFTTKHMANLMIESINKTFEAFTPKDRFEIINVQLPEQILHTGINQYTR